MELAARYYDGQVAEPRDVVFRIEGTREGGTIVIADAAGLELGRWSADAVYPVHARRDELRIASPAHPGARLVVSGTDAMARARLLLPALAHKHHLERGKQVRIAVISTLALVSVVLAYVYGVPLLASRLVAFVPADWERSLGDTVAEQIEASLSETSGFTVCDPDPESLANRAISRFARAAMEGSGSPFAPEITVIKSDLPNAFALPGGRSYYFSALLERTETADEFAGVLAHELGHVVHRHGMEQLISTAGTGALIGFILGDMTGASVAAGLGATLIDSRFSREAERQADRYSASVARRLAFKPAGLADLLDRVSEDDDFSRALAWLSTHPLTGERRQALEALSVEPDGLEPPFSAAEWEAIKTMCGSATADAKLGTEAPDPDDDPSRRDRKHDDKQSLSN